MHRVILVDPDHVAVVEMVRTDRDCTPTKTFDMVVSDFESSLTTLRELPLPRRIHVAMKNALPGSCCDLQFYCRTTMDHVPPEWTQEILAAFNYSEHLEPVAS